MDFRQINPQFVSPEKGVFLISEPFLDDLHFRRTVILLGEHNDEGSVGFVLNRLLNITTQDVVPDLLDSHFPLYYGGPVETNTLHFIHSAGELIKGAQHIVNGIYWGGDIEAVNEMISMKLVDKSEFRFFLGYSGWAFNQLQEEINNKAWWIAQSSDEVVFKSDQENMWRLLVKTLGNDFAYMADSPEDPKWN